MRVEGVGLGLRAPLGDAILEEAPACLRWLELAPENFLRRGGRYRELLTRARERLPVVTHGVSLSLGGTDELPRAELRELRALLRDLGVPWHSDHACFGRVGGAALHELLPLPLTRAAARHLAARAARVQDLLGVPLALENVTAYARPDGAELDEADFLAEVVREAGVRLLLDVNNVYVNCRNHGGDPRELIGRLPLEAVVQLHVAGHDASDPTLLIDTHAEAVVDPVFELLEWTLERTGPRPVLLERDDGFPEWSELVAELERIDAIHRRATGGG
ncbi:MAG: DUF692 domain-containing protein [Deltaproteobacteria bacterium]|nr:DUF692 domain-containing protein [Deltaproteobacteria bacterium]